MILEIRTYRLQPGTADEFVRVMRDEAVPLLARFGIRVVDCGASLVAEDGHEEAYLIRAFADLAAHHEQEEAFYSSDAWRRGPRDAVLSRIVTYHTVVLEVSEEAVRPCSDVARDRNCRRCLRECGHGVAQGDRDTVGSDRSP